MHISEWISLIVLACVSALAFLPAFNKSKTALAREVWVILGFIATGSVILFGSLILGQLFHSETIAMFALFAFFVPPVGCILYFIVRIIINAIKRPNA